MPSYSKKGTVCAEINALCGCVWSINKVTYKRPSATNSNIQLQPSGKGPATKAKSPFETRVLLLDTDSN